jgi:hypothetical protein
VSNKIRLFVGSSLEALEVAKAVQAGLDYDLEVTVWSQGVFNASDTTMGSLVKALGNFDAALFVFSADDKSTIRNNEYSIVRDNVVFEMGLFVGRLGLERVFFLCPRGINLHLPSDFAGVTPLNYEANRSDRNLVSAVGAACTQLVKQIRSLKSALTNSNMGQTSEVMSDDDVCTILVSWLQRSLIDSVTRPLTHTQLEQDLGLARGTSTRLIARAIAASERPLKVTVNSADRLQLAEVRS